MFKNIFHWLFLVLFFIITFSQVHSWWASPPIWWSSYPSLWWTICPDTDLSDTWLNHLTATGSPYVVTSSLTLSSWCVLRIEAGTEILVENWISITISWNLQANWTLWNPIVFTSYNDNSWLNTEWNWNPLAWSWTYIYMNWSWSDWSLLDYVEIKYWWSSSAWIHFSSSDSTLTNSLISNSATRWIYTTSSFASISNNTVDNNWAEWIEIYNWTPVLIDSNTITNNWSDWLKIWSIAVAITNNIISWNTWYWINSASYTSTFLNNQVLNNWSAIYSKSVEPYLVWSNTTITWNTNERLWIAFEMVWLTWTIKNYPWYNYHVIDSKSIDSWETLTIEAWNIFKVDAW